MCRRIVPTKSACVVLGSVLVIAGSAFVVLGWRFGDSAGYPITGAGLGVWAFGSCVYRAVKFRRLLTDSESSNTGLCCGGVIRVPRGYSEDRYLSVVHEFDKEEGP